MNDDDNYTRMMRTLEHHEEILTAIDACTDLATLVAIARNTKPEKQAREIRLRAERALSDAGLGGRRRRARR